MAGTSSINLKNQSPARATSDSLPVKIVLIGITALFFALFLALPLVVVFQHYALFGHMSVFENIAFSLRVLPRAKRPNEDAIRARVLELLQAVQLEGYEKRLPSQLSGGQRQRVAFARALAIGPDVLLLDEPFGALDAKVRKDLRRWLREFHDRTRLTTIFVTHDQDEAFEVADRVVLIDKGIVQQIGTPEEVKRGPRNDFVADFLGLATPLAV
jgi:sulfate transport system ATP-binding protein